MTHTTETQSPALTSSTITRAEVQAVRDHALSAMSGHDAADLVRDCDAALAEPFPGEANYEGGSTRTALYGRGRAARELTAIRQADAAEFATAVSGQPAGER